VAFASRKSVARRFTYSRHQSFAPVCQLFQPIDAFLVAIPFFLLPVALLCSRSRCSIHARFAPDHGHRICCYPRGWLFRYVFGVAQNSASFRAHSRRQVARQQRERAADIIG
jgi:hypothetical protein